MISKMIGLTGEKLSGKYKYFIYLVCSVCICWIGVWRDIGNGAQWAFASNCIGFCIAPMILCRFKLKDFFRIPYLAWTFLFMVAVVPIYRRIAPGTDYDAQYVAALINVLIYGLFTIRLYLNVFVEKSSVSIRRNIVFVLWLAMMAWCIVSVNESIWPLWYLVMFGAFYLAPASKEEVSEMVSGISDGIIISFFWIQSRAFLYRTYDLDPRYCGHFTNSNINAMFYQLSLVGILTRLWISSDNSGSNGLWYKVRKIIFSVLAVSILVFVNYTGSRGYFLAVSFMLLIYLIADVFRKEKNRIASFCIKGGVILVLFIALIYPVYACMRYIPALRHHPIWYRDYSEARVHSWDPMDSSKYITFDEALSGSALSRAVDKTKEIFGLSPGDEEEISGAFSYNLTMLGCKIGLFSPVSLSIPSVTVDYPGGTWVLEYDDGIEPGTDPDHDALLDYDPSGTWDIRKFIWKYFLERLNFFGHSDLNAGAYIGYYWGHTHNSFLQMAYLFGIPAGLLFLLMIICGIVITFIRIVRSDKIDADRLIFPLLLFSGYLISGMFECTALTGEALFTFVFVAVDVVAREIKRCNTKIMA